MCTDWEMRVGNYVWTGNEGVASAPCKRQCMQQCIQPTPLPPSLFPQSYVNDTSLGASTVFLVSRVGNITYERDYWGRPERQDYRRPAFAITMQQGASDLGGQVAAGLAAASVALGDSDPLLSQALVREARNVWRFANFTKMKWTDWDIQVCFCVCDCGGCSCCCCCCWWSYCWKQH